MTWAKLDDRFHGHRKVRRAWRRSRASIGLFALALTYSAMHELDGVIDEDWVAEQLPQQKERDMTVAALIDAGLWEPHPEGWLIHDYLEYNPSAANSERVRGVDRFRKELSRDQPLLDAIRNRDNDLCRYCGLEVNWKDRRSATGGTYDHVIPVSQDGVNSFENVVVACRGCNIRKGARTPAEAGMVLRVLSRDRTDLSAGIDRDKSVLSASSNPDPTRPDPTQTGTETSLVEPSRLDTARDRLKAKADEQTVFDEWIAVTGRTGRTVFDAKRRRMITNALKLYPLDEVLDAVRGWDKDPHNRGENDRQTVYNDVEHMLSGSKRLEHFRDLQRSSTDPCSLKAKLVG